MSFEKIIAVRKLENINSTHKLILLVIATHIGQNEYAFPSIPTLAKECCLSERRIYSNIKELSELGLLVKLKSDGKFKSNRYALNLSTPLTERHPDGKSPLTESHYTPDVSSGYPCRSVTPPLTERHPKENINNNEKKKKEKTQTFFSDEPEKQKREAEKLKQEREAQRLEDQRQKEFGKQKIREIMEKNGFNKMLINRR